MKSSKSLNKCNLVYGDKGKRSKWGERIMFGWDRRVQLVRLVSSNIQIVKLAVDALQM